MQFDYFRYVAVTCCYYLWFLEITFQFAAHQPPGCFTLWRGHWWKPMVAVDAAQQEWLSSQDCGSAGLGVGTNRKCLTVWPSFQLCIFLQCLYWVGLLVHDFFQSNFIPPMCIQGFKDALSQVVVEYDEEIPYDQDLAIRYSPFPIHQLCHLVVAHGVCKGPGAKIWFARASWHFWRSSKNQRIPCHFEAC